MIAVLIGIIVIIGLLAVILVSLGIGLLIGFRITLDDLMDDPCLRVAALRVLGDDGSLYKSWYNRHEIFIKDQMHDKL